MPEVEKEISAMNIAFDFSNKFTIARVPRSYETAEDFALKFVRYLVPFVAKMLNIDYTRVVLVAISQNNKVVVYKVCDWSRSWLFYNFKLSNTKVYDDVDPETIIDEMKLAHK